jgi:hypothetical protein
MCPLSYPLTYPSLNIDRMSSYSQDVVEQVRNTIKPIGLSGTHGMMAVAIVGGLVILNFLRKYISVRRVSQTFVVSYRPS